MVDRFFLAGSSRFANFQRQRTNAGRSVHLAGYYVGLVQELWRRYWNARQFGWSSGDHGNKRDCPPRGGLDGWRQHHPRYARTLWERMLRRPRRDRVDIIAV